ncbi:glutathione peroxidase 7-like [Babylonia areolata]|uniref:glutathione peroxidase 7-like n=1 Tax=Babylonia areolata TaxID=304850 RepID=UPI003FD557AB
MKRNQLLSPRAWVALIFLINSSVATGELDFYSYTVMDIHENIISLEEYRGKVSLVVNVASACGYTDNHYKSLVRLQELLADTDRFNVLAFPCNQFGRQEPGSNLDIYDFATEKYGANFPLFAKVDVKGPSALDAWKYLSEQSGREPDWNFWKYLIDSNGKVVDAWGPWMDPDRLYNIISSTIRRAEKEDKAEDKTSRGENCEHVEILRLCVQAIGFV